MYIIENLNINIVLNYFLFLSKDNIDREKNMDLTWILSQIMKLIMNKSNSWRAHLHVQPLQPVTFELK